MNPVALLTLISDLYSQLSAQNTRVQQLEAELAECKTPPSE